VAGVPICTPTVSQGELPSQPQETSAMKKSRGGRMTAAKKRAAKKPGGKGRVKSRKAGKNIMKT
jgi:hypothetical protein